MEFAIEYAGRHPILVGIAICTTLVLMLFASMIRAFQRWEILPDPLLSESPRRMLEAIRKAVAKVFNRELSGKDEL